jgi:hypothetical protein
MFDNGRKLADCEHRLFVCGNAVGMLSLGQGVHDARVLGGGSDDIGEADPLDLCHLVCLFVERKSKDGGSVISSAISWCGSPVEAECTFLATRGVMAG